MVVKRIGVVLFLIGLSLYSKAQSERDSIRSLYIQEFKDDFFFWPVLKQRSLNFVVSDKKQSKSVTFQPNSSYSIGIGGYLFDLGFEVTFAIPLNEKSEYRYGTSKARDWQINALAKKWGADLYYQKYSGFYESGSDIDPGDGPFPQRSDISTRNFGVTGLYVFNEKKYSLKSPFTFAERQLKNGGSIILASALNSFKLEADSAVVDSVYMRQLGSSTSFKELHYTTFSVAPGYAYNFVYKDFFLSGALTIGPAHNWIYYRNENNSEKNDIRINLFTSFRIGLGYNGDRFFTGVNFVRQSRAARFENIQFESASTTFRLLVGYRFKEFGILKKNVGDLTKML